MPASEVLPRPGGPANSRWSAGCSPLERRLDDDPEVLGQLALPDELVEGPGAEAGLLRLLGRRRHRDRRPDAAARRSVAGVDRRRAGQHLAAGLRASSVPRPARGGRPHQLLDRPSSSTTVQRPARSRRGRSPARPARPGPRPGASPPAAGGRRYATVRGSGRSSRAFSSSSSRAAVFLPTPGTRHRVSTSSSSTAVDRAAGDSADRMARASDGPDAVGAEQGLEAAALVGVGEAVEDDGVLAHVGVDVEEHLAARGRRGRPAPRSAPTPGSRPRRRRRSPRRATGRSSQHPPERADHRRPPRSAAATAAPAAAGWSGGRRPGPGRRPRRAGGAARPGRAPRPPSAGPGPWWRCRSRPGPASPRWTCTGPPRTRLRPPPPGPRRRPDRWPWPSGR